MPIPENLTPRERAAVEGYHCTVHTCRAQPGEMCRRDRGLYVVVARELKHPHPERCWAADLGPGEEAFLVAQAQMIISRLGCPVSRGRLVVVLEILRTIRQEPGR